ncbi:MAG TPA: hypothetical protein VLD19_21695, partial [Chitinophagaceae bacterium]|nr:hypothetical protein [Chitinophagaceae bacterium]
MQQKGAWILVLYSLVAVVCYYPVLGNTFLSDDYDSLYRVLIEKRVIYKGFLRPLTDVLFYSNYLVSGLNPFSYYILNLLLHILCAFMVYRIALRLSLFDKDRQTSFAVVSGLLFLVYPFHNEGIAWLTGRIVSAACLCGLLALYWSLQEGKPWRYFAAGAFVFLLGLTGYESIILLPFIIFVLNKAVLPSRRGLPAVIGAWTGIMLLYLVARFFLSGTVTSGYGQRIFSFSD